MYAEIFGRLALGSPAYLTWRRVLLSDIGSSNSHPLYSGQQSFLNALDVGFRFESRHVGKWMCKIYWCRKTRNTDDSPLFRYETFINFLTLVFRYDERERHNFYFADCSYIAHNQPPSWTGHAQSRISTNIFFKITKSSAHCFRAWRHSHPSPIFYLGFLLRHLWLSYPLRASVNCTQCVCTCNKSRIAQSPTKPNDKI